MEYCSEKYVAEAADRIREILPETGRLHIAVIGDYCLDKYLYMDAERDEPSLETGLTAYQVDHSIAQAGAAGSVARNLLALGALVSCVGLTGDDGEGYELRRKLSEAGADTLGMIVSPEMQTNAYLKPMRRKNMSAYAEQSRMDLRNFRPISSGTENALLTRLVDILPLCDGVMIVDQFVQPDSGVVTKNVRRELNQLAAHHIDKLFFADSRAFIGHFMGMTVKCNHFELASALASGRESGGRLEDICSMGRKLQSCSGGPAFITLGSGGILTIDGQEEWLIPAYPADDCHIDVTGAGDASSAALTLGLLLGLEARQAAVLGNCVSAVTIRRLGATGTASPGETEAMLLDYVKKYGTIE